MSAKKPKPRAAKSGMGTCAYCNLRVKVAVPRGSKTGLRACAQHDMPITYRKVLRDPSCPGSRKLCVEDNHQPIRRKS